MPSAPRFFFSHARFDGEKPGSYLLRFFQDLEKTVVDYSGLNPPLGTIDRRVVQGADWDSFLSGGLMSDKAFVAILTPRYPKRLNCGKELGVFLLRNKGLGINADGHLIGVRNVLPIRWMPRDVYKVNGELDALIPIILKGLQDVPGDDLSDLEQSRAIARYRRDGMEKCVQPGRRYYKELLGLIAKRIVDMDDLPASEGASFATATDAFSYDWAAHLGSPAPPSPPIGPPAAPALSAATKRPQPLQSLVAFYLTQHQHTLAAPQPDLPYRLIVEPSDSLAATATDSQLARLLADVRAAATDEKLAIFHAMTPVSDLLAQLIALSQAHILVALVVDADMPFGPDIQPIVQSKDWRGPVFQLSPSANDTVTASRVTLLPEDEAQRMAVLHRVLVEARGDVLSSSMGRQPNTERLPLLKGVGGERL